MECDCRTNRRLLCWWCQSRTAGVPASFCSAIFLLNMLNWRRPHHSSEVRPRSLHRRWPVYADAWLHVQKTVSCCFAALHQLRQIRRYVPTSTFQKLVVAKNCHGAFPAGLWQRRTVGGYSCPPNTSTPINSEWSSTAYLQSEMLHPHHRCTRQPSLTAGPGAHTV